LSKAQDGNKPFAAGRHTLAEILSQPQCWKDCLALLKSDGPLKSIAERFAGTQQWLFVGCGSSYYIALTAAASWAAITGQEARAVPASEVLLYPDLAWPRSGNFVPVLISRSGKTSEVVRAAEFFRHRGTQTVAISCAPGQPLEREASASIILSAADEQSMVMTRSFTSMLLALQNLAAVVAGNVEIIEALQQLPPLAERAFTGLHESLERFVSQNDFEDYVCLGQGPFYGLACEAALKLTEMSCSYGQAFHTLEFRHGPKSIVSPQTLITFLLAAESYQPELEVLEEIQALGGTTVAISPKHESRARAAADIFVEFPFDLPQVVRAVAYVYVPQLIALYTGVKKGLNPDAPRNLSRVVMLSDESNPQHATL
jgi:glucosamine--fructose-6-phosphate aminotransferase (isomerizing)